MDVAGPDSDATRHGIHIGRMQSDAVPVDTVIVLAEGAASS